MSFNDAHYRKLRAELINRTERYARGVKQLYDNALVDISRLMAGVEYEPTKPFSFEDYGLFNRVDTIMTALEGNIRQVVEKGILAEFGASYAECTSLLNEVLSKETSERVMKAFAPKLRATEAAQEFARKAPSVSMRVWNGSTLAQMEAAMQEGLMDGMPAKRLATHLKQFLNEPDEYFRRFRVKVGEDADGNPLYGRKLKKRYQLPDGSYKWRDATPEDLKKETGVYRSSYKNALRYARTTTNIAYRTADYERYQDFPFVIGIEIRVSQTNHLQPDVCDDLAGRYPKEFKWTGWHPNCRCYQVPILASADEIDGMTDAILDGDDPAEVEVDGRVEELPENFTEYLTKNKERAQAAYMRGTTPYFIQDNIDSFKEIKAATTGTDGDMYKLNRRYMSSKFRDASNESISAYQRAIVDDITSNIDIKKLRGYLYRAKLTEDDKSFVLSRLTDVNKALKNGDGILASNILDSIGLSADQTDTMQKLWARGYSRMSSSVPSGLSSIQQSIWNLHEKEFADALGITKGQPMNFHEADHGRSNPLYRTDRMYRTNCQTCVVVHEMRLRGFGVEALGRTTQDRAFDTLAHFTNRAWRTIDGRAPEYMVAKGASYTDLLMDFDRITNAPGRYTVQWSWQGRGSGHIISLERFSDGLLRVYDPQTDKVFCSLKDYLDTMNSIEISDGLRVLKVDDCFLSDAFFSIMKSAH